MIGLSRAIERSEERDAALLGMLPHVAFTGWTEASLRAGLADAGEEPGLAAILFPGGPAEMVEYFADWADRMMAAELARLDIGTFRIRARIALAVRTRLEVVAPWREAVRRALAFLAVPKPSHAAIAARTLARTVDAIWRACGDRAADFSWYTKRATLAGVYSTTLLYWLRDESEDCNASWAFLDRRINEVMQIPKLRENIRAAACRFRLPDPLGLFRHRPGRAGASEHPGG